MSLRTLQAHMPAQQAAPGPNARLQLVANARIRRNTSAWNPESRRRVITHADASVRVKLGMAAERGSLDLSECDLETVPLEAFKVPGLKDLSLAGNNLLELPEEIGQLTALERLQLSGNCFRTLPDSIGKLAELKGLWLHGNVLRALPESLGRLTALRQLSLSGNQLATLPSSLNSLTALVELEIAGNAIEQLPLLEGLTAVVKLSAHGNALRTLPESLGTMTSLRELWLQGNAISSLPASIGGLGALQQLSVAENQLVALPRECSLLTSLCSLSIYSNKLTALPEAIFNLPSLRDVWLEDNPIGMPISGDRNSRHQQRHQQPPAEAAVSAASATGHCALGPQLRNVGLDQRQLTRLPGATLECLADVVRPAEVPLLDDGVRDSAADSANVSTADSAADLPGFTRGGGYFKLKRAQHSGSNGNGNSATKGSSRTSRLLVVAFGSAPGVPNWAGALQRATNNLDTEELRQFDTLFVVDPRRSWYDGGCHAGYERYRRQLASYTEQHDRVFMIGDSMGGTGALMFSGLATAVHAFAPQVDLQKSSIRPGNGASWRAALRERVRTEVASSSADVTIHVGNWYHDVRQAREIPAQQAKLLIYDLDSHRLPYHLDKVGKLVPTLERELRRQLATSEEVLRSKVRMVNLL